MIDALFAAVDIRSVDVLVSILGSLFVFVVSEPPLLTLFSMKWVE